MEEGGSWLRCMGCLLIKKTKAGHMPSKGISIHMRSKVIETALNWHWEPTGDGPDPRQVEPILDSMI